MEIRKNRNPSLDFVRCMAGILVVVTHVSERIYNFGDINNFVLYSTKQKFFSLIMFTLGRLGVPLFLFLTGFLMLNRTYDKEEISKFYKNKFLTLLITWEIWTIIYSIFQHSMGSEPFNLLLLFERMFFVIPGQLPHCWYMPMIIGMYVFLPFVANVLNRYSTSKHHRIIIIVLYVYLFIIPFIAQVQSLQGTLNVIYSQIDLSFGGNTYGLYLLLGFCLKKYEKQIICIFKKYVFLLTIIFILLLSFTVTFQLYTYSLNNAFNVYYNFWSIPLLALYLFCIIYCYSKKNINLINELSKCTFGIYLFHELVLQILDRIIHLNLKPHFAFMIYVVLIYLISALTVYILQKAKYGKRLFMIK